MSTTPAFRRCRIRGINSPLHLNHGLPSSLILTMSTQPPKKKIGGEYGEIRANIDIDSLNAYLKAHTPGIATPVNVKQFKVS